jgi:hypothetical protein
VENLSFPPPESRLEQLADEADVDVYWLRNWLADEIEQATAAQEEAGPAARRPRPPSA